MNSSLKKNVAGNMIMPAITPMMTFVTKVEFSVPAKTALMNMLPMIIQKRTVNRLGRVKCRLFEKKAPKSLCSVANKLVTFALIIMILRDSFPRTDPCKSLKLLPANIAALASVAKGNLCRSFAFA